jgi:hypothetical protein
VRGREREREIRKGGKSVEKKKNRGAEVKKIEAPWSRRSLRSFFSFLSLEVGERKNLLFLRDFRQLLLLLSRPGCLFLSFSARARAREPWREASR